MDTSAKDPRESEDAYTPDARVALAGDLLGIFDLARDVILVLHDDGEIVAANAAVQRVYGLAAEEVVGTNIRFLRSAATAHLIPSQMETAARGGVLFETVHVRADGSEFPVEVSSRGVRLGERDGIVSVVRDISERCQREAEREALIGELELANARLDSALRVTSGALETLDLDALLATVLADLREVTRADAAVLMLREGDELVVRAQSGADAWTRPGFRLASGEGFGGRVTATGAPLYTADVTGSDMMTDALLAGGVHSMYGVPLTLAGEPFGVLELAWHARRTVDEPDGGMVQLAAERITLAIANAQMYERARRAERLSSALHDVGSLVNSSLDPSETLPGALERVVAALGVDVAYLEHPALPGGAIRVGALRSGFVGVSAVLDSFEREPDEVIAGEPGTLLHDWLAESAGVHASLTVAFGGTSKGGALLVGCLEPGAPFDSAAAAFVREVGTVIAQAIANAARYRAEHEIAETLQEALLTVPPVVRGLDFAHLYRSATTTTRVGGDFYDVFELARGRIGVIIGDVSGKGLSAAVLTSVVKDTIRAYAHETSSPSEVMARANTALFARAKTADFASVLFAVLDTRERTMTYCNAGHPTPVLLDTDGGVTLLDCISPVIGAFEGLEYDSASADLKGGRVAFFYTDGVTEARAADGSFLGEERLLATVARTGPDVDRLPSAVFDEVMRFTGGTLSDDVAVMAFRLP